MDNYFSNLSANFDKTKVFFSSVLSRFSIACVLWFIWLETSETKSSLCDFWAAKKYLTIKHTTSKALMPMPISFNDDKSIGFELMISGVEPATIDNVVGAWYG